MRLFHVNGVHLPRPKLTSQFHYRLLVSVKKDARPIREFHALND